MTVAFNQQEALAGAREMLPKHHAIIRIESDAGEILESKALQEAMTARPAPDTFH